MWHLSALGAAIFGAGLGAKQFAIAIRLEAIGVSSFLLLVVTPLLLVAMHLLLVASCYY